MQVLPIINEGDDDENLVWDDNKDNLDYIEFIEGNLGVSLVYLIEWLLLIYSPNLMKRCLIIALIIPS